jgi:hypothetical protein
MNMILSFIDSGLLYIGGLKAGLTVIAIFGSFKAWW